MSKAFDHPLLLGAFARWYGSRQVLVRVAVRVGPQESSMFTGLGTLVRVFTLVSTLSGSFGSSRTENAPFRIYAALATGTSYSIENSEEP